VALGLRHSITEVEGATAELLLAAGSVDAFLHYAIEVSNVDRRANDTDRPGSTERGSELGAS
jgi:hypothetical protein